MVSNELDKCEEAVEDAAASEQMPDEMRAQMAGEIDILLTETNTIWMLQLLGTCVEVDPEAAASLATCREDEGKSRQEGEDEEMLEDTSNYELLESWTQTLDFSKKRKGAQCDNIVLANESTQVRKMENLGGNFS